MFGVSGGAAGAGSVFNAATSLAVASPGVAGTLVGDAARYVGTVSGISENVSNNPAADATREETDSATAVAAQARRHFFDMFFLPIRSSGPIAAEERVAVVDDRTSPLPGHCNTPKQPARRSGRKQKKSIYACFPEI